MSSRRHRGKTREEKLPNARFDHEPVTAGAFKTKMGVIIWVKRNIKPDGVQKCQDRASFFRQYDTCITLATAMVEKGVCRFQTLSTFEMMAAIFVVNCKIKHCISTKSPVDKSLEMKNQLQLLLVTNRRNNIVVREPERGLSQFLELKHKMWCTHVPKSLADKWKLLTDEQMRGEELHKRRKGPSRHTVKSLLKKVS